MPANAQKNRKSDVNSLQKEVRATLKRLEQKDPGLKQFLDDAYGYAVFPNVGKAALVVGGAYGKGLVFRKGEPIGYATIAQTTIGVQVGGDTFSEVIAFESKEALERFKKGKIAFAANASAVLVKAGAAGTADYEKGVAAFAYANGGMLLEAAIGGQKFKFKPLDGQRQQDQSDDEEGEEGGQGQEKRGLLGGATSKVTGLVKQHPIATLLGAGLIGVVWMTVRSMKSPGGGSKGKGGDDEEGHAQDEYEEESQDQEEESGDYEDEGGQDDEDQEQEEEEEAPSRSRR